MKQLEGKKKYPGQAAKKKEPFFEKLKDNALPKADYGQEKLSDKDPKKLPEQDKKKPLLSEMLKPKEPSKMFEKPDLKDKYDTKNQI